MHYVNDAPHRSDHLMADRGGHQREHFILWWQSYLLLKTTDITYGQDTALLVVKNQVLNADLHRYFCVFLGAVLLFWNDHIGHNLSILELLGVPNDVLNWYKSVVNSLSLWLSTEFTQHTDRHLTVGRLVHIRLEYCWLRDVKPLSRNLEHRFLDRYFKILFLWRFEVFLLIPQNRLRRSVEELNLDI